jgi:hypothetical protein
MKTRLQEKLATLILEEMSVRLKERNKILELLTEFSEFPPEIVTEEFLNEFEKLLDSGLRQEILKRLSLPEQILPAKPSEAVRVTELKPKIKEQKTEEVVIEPKSISEVTEVKSKVEEVKEVSEVPTDIISEVKEHIAPTEIELTETKSEIPAKEKISVTTVSDLPVFTEPRLETERPSIFFRKEKKTDIAIDSNDCIYLYGFSYAPNSEGKGFPSIELEIDGVEQGNKIFGLDYGDVRIFMSKINLNEYVTVRTGEPVLKSHEAINLKFQHAWVLNKLKANEMLVPLDFWTIRTGREKIVRMVEEKYINYLHALIDVHDAIDWDVEVSVLDEHIMKALSIDTKPKAIDLRREGRHQKVPRIEIKNFEKVLFKEKDIAHQINTTLTHVANKIKVDHMISLESSFLDGWKPILSARYVIGIDKRKAFHQSVLELQERFEKFKIMINVGSPKVRFKYE